MEYFLILYEVNAEAGERPGFQHFFPLCFFSRARSVLILLPVKFFLFRSNDLPWFVWAPFLRLGSPFCGPAMKHSCTALPESQQLVQLKGSSWLLLACLVLAQETYLVTQWSSYAGLVTVAEAGVEGASLATKATAISIVVRAERATR